jgi:hypothetical protein
LIGLLVLHVFGAAHSTYIFHINMEPVLLAESTRGEWLLTQQKGVALLLVFGFIRVFY